MTRDEAHAMAQARNETDCRGRWFARRGEQGWDVVRVTDRFDAPVRATGAAQRPGPYPQPQTPSTLPGGVSPWAAGT